MDPQVLDPGVQVVLTNETELLLALRGLVIGTSSRLFHWNADRETFDLGGIIDERQVQLAVDGWDTTLLARYSRSICRCTWLSVE